MADRQALYAALDPDLQRILRVLSVICEPVGQTQVKKVLSILGWRDRNGALLSQSMDSALRLRFDTEGLIVQPVRGMVCHPDLLEPLTRECVADGTFAAIVKAAEQIIPSNNPFERPTDERRFRLLRIALYSRRKKQVLDILGLNPTMSARDVGYHSVQPLARACTHPPDATLFQGLGPRLQVLVLAPMLRQAGLDLTPYPGLKALAEQFLPALALDHPDAAEALAEWHLVRGRLAAVQPHLPGRTDPAALTLEGWWRCLLGDYPGAIASFETAQQTTRKLTRKRKVYVPGLPGALYLAALLKRGERDDLGLVRQLVATSQRADADDPIALAFRVLDDLAAVLGGQQRLAECLWLRHSIDPRQPWPLLFQVLALHWLGERPPGESLAGLAAHAQRAITAGCEWYAQEALALLRTYRYQGQSPTLAAPPAGLVLLTDLLVARPAWELALDALRKLGGAAEPAPAAPGADAGPQQRLAWQLVINDLYCTVEPREQTRTKRGGWTQGRPVSLQRLAETPDSLTYLSPQDRAVCACIVREQESNWYGGRDRLTYRLDTDRALLALVDHPLVLRPTVGDQPIELVRGSPTLTVVRKGKTNLVSITPFPPADRSVLPVVESPQRLRLIQFDPQHREIGRILSPDGLRVPAEAEARLLEGLAAVAPLVTVHADIGTAAGKVETNFETIRADPRPHLHLSPFEEGLTLDLHVHPCGDAGPQLRPGQGGSTLLTELAGRAVRWVRDLPAELGAARRVLNECPVLAGNDGWNWTLTDPELALTALEQLQALGEAVALDWPEGKCLTLTREAQLGQMAIKVKAQGDWLEVGGGLRLDDGRVLAMRTLLELAAASGGRFIRLGEDQVLVLSNALRRRLDGLRGLTDQGRFHPLAAPAIAELVDGMEVAAAPAWQSLLERLAAARDLEPALPSTLQAELRDYQAEGYRWLARLAHWGAGACLADDMGLGKTVEALALILARAPGGPTLVLAPTSVCGNWIDEARRFAPTLNPRRFGPGDRAAVLQDAGPFDLIVCSYGLLQTEGERLTGVTWETVVADEAQAFKNALTKRSQAIMKLNGGFRMIATGTPIENRLGELWNLFRFINPGLLGSQESFNRRFATPIEQDRDPGARQRLRQLLRPFILRRLKSEVLSELPPRTEITLSLELSEGERALYEAMRRQAIERLEENAEINPGEQRLRLLAEIMRLRRTCCHPSLVLPGSDLPSAKLEAFSEIVDELLDNRHKALVFSQFVDHLSLLRAHLDARGIRYQYLDGSTPEPQRRAAVAAFQAGEGELFLISLRAGGFGLNLTAADYVIHMDPWWNPAVEDQASDRAHRIGQERPVTIYRLVAKDTIEERILKLHATKRDLADGLLEGTGDGGRLSYDDMLALVRGAAETA